MDHTNSLNEKINNKNENSEMINKDILIRKALIQDSKLIVDNIKMMVKAMNEYGGYLPTNNEHNWEIIKENVEEIIKNEKGIYLLIEDETKNIGYGAGEIQIISKVFSEIKSFHISGIFIDKNYRNNGLGKKVVDKLILWAKENKCEEVDLNVLINNPAYKTYKNMGFKEFTMKMRKKL